MDPIRVEDFVTADDHPSQATVQAEMAATVEWLTARYGVEWQWRIDANLLDMQVATRKTLDGKGCLVAQLGDRWCLTLVPASCGQATADYDDEWKAYIRTWQCWHGAVQKPVERCATCRAPKTHTALHTCWVAPDGVVDIKTL